MNEWQPYFIAAVIGLLVGIEREKAHPTQKTMGVRTFVLIGLLGAVAKGIRVPWLGGLVTAFSLALILVSYFNQTRSRSKSVDRGLTTEFAAALVFALGYAAAELPALSAFIGPGVAVILFSKQKLHRFTRALKHTELEATLLLFLGGVVVINLFPDNTIDPWKIFNPRKLGYLVLTLAALEFASYVTVKVIGEKTGTLLVGFFGGLVSSTAVILSSARNAKKSPQYWRTPLASTLAATLASLLELSLIVGLISMGLLVKLAPALGASIVFGAIALIVVALRNKDGQSEISIKSPLDWAGVLRLSLLLAAILSVLSVTQHLLGNRGTFAFSFLAGLFELHGVALANATMFAQKQFAEVNACTNILIAAAASLVAKTAIGWGIGRGNFARALTAVFVPMLALVLGIGWLTLR